MRKLFLFCPFKSHEGYWRCNQDTPKYFEQCGEEHYTRGSSERHCAKLNRPIRKRYKAKLNIRGN